MKANWNFSRTFINKEGSFLWNDISITSRELMKEVLDLVSVDETKFKTIKHIADKYDEDEEYISILFREKKNDIGKIIAEKIGPKKMKFFISFREGTDQWLSYRLGIRIKEVQALKEYLKKEEERAFKRGRARVS